MNNCMLCNKQIVYEPGSSITNYRGMQFHAKCFDMWKQLIERDETGIGYIGR